MSPSFATTRPVQAHPTVSFRHKITGDILNCSDDPRVRAVAFAHRNRADWEHIPFGAVPGAIEMAEMMAGQA